ncbi:MAG: L-threonylcarbamoyladenylate synthase [Pseudomonadota bacterium]
MARNCGGLRGTVCGMKGCGACAATATYTLRHDMPPDNLPILPADQAGIAAAADLLAQGRLVALPTETVYGLAADATNGHAVAGIFAAKDRPAFNPLIVHLLGVEDAQELADLPSLAMDLAGAFWPGPLTLVLPRRSETALAGLVCAGLDSVALRAPAHPITRSVLNALGRPIAAPSANRSGALSSTHAAHVVAGLNGRIDAVLDGQAAEIGVESTILSVVGDEVRLLRDGGLPREAIERMTGPLSSDTAPKAISAPGQLSSHYAPNATLEMASDLSDSAAVRIGFGPDPRADLSLSHAGDLIDAAARLFAVLHEADALAAETGRRRIAVAPVPMTGLGRAINDRLRRAAAPRMG